MGCPRYRPLLLFFPEKSLNEDDILYLGQSLMRTAERNLVLTQERISIAVKQQLCMYRFLDRGFVKHLDTLSSPEQEGWCPIKKQLEHNSKCMVRTNVNVSMGDRAMQKSIVTISAASLLAGCATTPEVTLSYRYPTWTVVATITQTLGCTSGDKSKLIVLNSPSVTTIYSSDYATPAATLNIHDLKGSFADAEISMSFTDDGRLKAVNQSSNGQGENILKAAISLGSLAQLLMLVPEEEDVTKACKVIDKWGGGKPITLTYKAKAQPGAQEADFEVPPESNGLYDEIKGALKGFTLKVGNITNIEGGPTYSKPASNDFVMLKLRMVGHADVAILRDKDLIGSTQIVVPNVSAPSYELPIPKAALFGKQTFALALSDAGAVSSISYGSTSGAAGTLNVLGAVANVGTPAYEAANLKAQADVIAQQQRLVLCQTKPDQCK